jgi:hypothetical protein
MRRDTRQAPVYGGLPLWGWGLIAALIVIAAAAGGFALASGGNSSSSTSNSATGSSAVRAAMLAAHCTYKDVLPLPPKKDKTNYHADVPTLHTPMKGLWSSFPPSGGAHYYQWALWGFYTDPVNPRQVVHNEEHGGVIIWWGTKVPASTVNQLQSFYQQQPVGVFGTPLTSIAGKSLGDKIALTAWTGNVADYYHNGYYGVGHVAICPNYNEHAFTVFRDAYRGKGPEGIPVSADQPNT